MTHEKIYTKKLRYFTFLFPEERAHGREVSVKTSRVQEIFDYPSGQKLKAMSGEIIPALRQAKTGKVIVYDRLRKPTDEIP